MKIIDNGITYPEGFFGTGIRCGIKIKGIDCGILYCPNNAVAAAVYTKNSFPAIHIIENKNILPTETFKLLFITAGNANAGTGPQGIKNYKSIETQLRKIFTLKNNEVIIINSTGVIGKQLPITNILKNLRANKLLFNSNKKDYKSFAKAIMTTDTKPKYMALLYKDINNNTIKIGVTAKGSGMIHPNMGTLLIYITTDINIETKLLQKALSKNIRKTFNRITIDGDQSTNDTAIIMSSRKAKNKLIKSKNDNFELFNKNLNYILNKLLIKVLQDGEGVTKTFKVTVRGLANRHNKSIAEKIAVSNLFKTAVFGADPNIGRIIAAAGSIDKRINTSKLVIKINNLTVFKNNSFYFRNMNKVKLIFSKDYFEIVLNFNITDKEYYYYSTDLSYDYIKINALYHT